MVGAIVGDDGIESNGILPLTPAQRGMWFAENLSADYSVNIAQYVDISHEREGLDLDLFVRCCEDVGKEVESPFVRLTEVDGVPMQYVDVDFDQHVQVLDLRGEPDPEATALDWMQRDYRKPVDLLRDQFIVIVFLRISDERTFWYNRCHHIILDGYAALSIMRRTVDRYNAIRRGERVADKAPASMAEIVAYEETYQKSTRRESDRAYWLERVRDLPERVTLSHRSTNVPVVLDNVVVSQQLEPELQRKLEATAKALNTSMAVLLTAAFSAFLARMSGTDDIVVSLPVTGRSTALIKRSAGMVSNILPIRLRDVLARTGRGLTALAQLEMTGALRHQRYRSDDIKRDAGLDGSSYGFGPRINMVFFDEPVRIDRAQVEYRILTSGTLEDLLVNLYQSGPGAPLIVDLHGNPHLYTPAEIETHHRRFLTFVNRMIDDLDAPIVDLDILLPGEPTELAGMQVGPLRQWAAVEASSTNLLELFLARVIEHPDRIAVVDGGGEWTYSQFNDMRRALAAVFAAHGVVIGDRVVVQLDRGIEQVAAIYAVLTLGAAYVPVDPAAPHARRESITSAAQPRLVVDSAFLEAVGFDSGPGKFPAPAVVRSGNGHSAYVIFTSGSTGVPKGVEVSVAAVANRLAWIQQLYPLAADDVFLYKTPFTFDVSVNELFWPLQVGARLVIARPGGHRDPDYLRRLIIEREVSAVHFVPSMLDVFAEATGPESPVLPSVVRRVFTSGEGLPAQLAHRITDESDAMLVNLYGPTEAAVEVTAYEVVGGESAIPIGRPVPNCRTYVLDARLRPVPVGVAGELYLAGVQLADGYVTKAGLTAERFVADPFAVGERMYRTGDLVRWNANADLDYLGRTDFQIKIRGQRVELGEIEAALLAEDCVDAAVAVVRTDAGVPAIVAYVRRVLPTDPSDVSDHLLRVCRRQLPAYMVPAAVVVLENFPLNASGKLDRSALPVPTPIQSVDVPFVPPATATERRLVSLLVELLSQDRVGLRDNMFALGADSLLAARLAARLRRELGVEVALNDVFESADVGELAARIDGSDGLADRPPLRPVVRPGVIPVAYAQLRLWFINRLDPAAATYNMPGAVRLGRSVDVDALRAAVLDVVDRHESLRTKFPAVDGEPSQDILPTSGVVGQLALAVHQIEPTDMHSAISAVVALGFDLVEEIPFRARLLRSGDEYVLVVVLHHIAGDGASLRPLIADLLSAYAARHEGLAPAWEPLPIQYADYALWQRTMLGDPADPDSRLSREIAFWRAELHGLAEVLALPTDRPRPRTPTGRGAYVDAVVPTPTVIGIRGLAARLGVTTFSVLQAALAVVLGRLADTDDVPLGTAIAGRDEPETTELVGMFVNTVVLRNRITPGDSVGDAVRAAHRTRTRALEHSQVPFEQVVGAVAPQRSRSHTPLFQVTLTLQRDSAQLLSAVDSGAELLDARTGTAKVDLEVAVSELSSSASDSMALELCYATDLFDRSTIEKYVDYLVRVLDAMVARPDVCVGQIDLLADRELQRLTSTVAPVKSRPATLREAIAIGARRAEPLAPMIVGNVNLTRRSFEDRTNQLGRELIARGIGAGDIVAVSVPRSHNSVIAMVAVVKAGAAFVMIDPRHPADRRADMIADSGAVLGITSLEVSEPADAVPWLALDSERDELQVAGHSGKQITDGELVRPVRPDNIAYLLFTSGSTGRPKGAAVSNRAIANLATNFVEKTAMTSGSCMLHVGAPSFDGAMGELSAALLAGSRIAVADFTTFAGRDLELFIAEHGATHACVTPAAVSTLDPIAVPTFTDIACGGEPLPEELVHRWTSLGNRRIYNIYGPTEAAVWVTCDGPYQMDDEVTIGSPGSGVGILVLDRGLRPVPVGVMGEMYVTGEQVGLGYAERYGLTASTFVANPFTPGTRMYRTGDRVTLRRDGRYEYHGRTDFQLKIRGQRIEPGELDAGLLKHPDVTNAVSVGVPGRSGETVLASYVTLVEGSITIAEDLIEFVSDRLPSFLVPRAIKVVDAFEWTPIGKIDRKKLPPIDFSSAQEYVAPRTQLEAIVADIFGQVLGVDIVSVKDDFFDLGGNSLSATKVTALIGGVIERQVPVAQLFETPTVAGLADSVGELMTEGPSAVPLGPRSRAAVVPVSGVQRGMWLLNRADPSSPAYNIALALRLEGSLDVAALSTAAKDLVERHESLRTSYPMINGEPSQVIEPVETAVEAFAIETVDVNGSLAGAIKNVTAVGFDVTVRPPVRLVLLRIAPAEHVVVLVMHHISADGASMAPLARDLMTAYGARVNGASPAWSPLRVQYADFTLWQAERLAEVDADGVSEEGRQLRYWKQRLMGAPDQISLPADRPRPSTPSFRGALVPFEIPVDLVRSLEAVAHGHNSTLFMVTQTAYALLLARLSGSTDVVVGTPYVGRSEPALDDVIGMFVNTLALRTQIQPNERFIELLARVRADDLADMANADVAFDAVTAALGVSRTAAVNPVFQAMFWFQNLDFPSVTLNELTISPVSEELTAAKVDLQLTLYPTDPTELTHTEPTSAMRGELLYALDLFDEEAVTTYVERYLRILEQVAEDPTIIVGDVSISTAALSSVDSDEPALPLPQLITQASEVAPTVLALDTAGAEVTFAALSAMTVTMSAALPDLDSALITALMSLVPSLATDGPDALGGTLEVIRTNAIAALAAHSDSTP